MLVTGFMTLRGLQCRYVYLSLLPYLWSLYSQRTEIDNFNFLLLEGMNRFLELSICFCNDYKVCQIEMFS